MHWSFGNKQASKKLSQCYHKQKHNGIRNKIEKIKIIMAVELHSFVVPKCGTLTKILLMHAQNVVPYKNIADARPKCGTLQKYLQLYPLEKILC